MTDSDEELNDVPQELNKEISSKVSSNPNFSRRKTVHISSPTPDLVERKVAEEK